MRTRTISREEAERFLPPGCIDPPSTSAPLVRWQEFLAGFETWPQHNEVVKRMKAWATEVIAWKSNGEVGPAPSPISPSMPVQERQ